MVDGRYLHPNHQPEMKNCVVVNLLNLLYKASFATSHLPVAWPPLGPTLKSLPLPRLFAPGRPRAPDLLVASSVLKQAGYLSHRNRIYIEICLSSFDS